jgi:hypothetical protein
VTAALLAPSLLSEVSALAAAYVAEPLPSLELEAMELLRGNQPALRAWADLTNAVGVLWELENTVNPWKFLDELDQTLDLDAETAEIRALENWTSERAGALKALLTAVSSW